MCFLAAENTIWTFSLQPENVHNCPLYQFEMPDPSRNMDEQRADQLFHQSLELRGIVRYLLLSWGNL